MKVLILGTDTLDCAAANCGIALRAMGHEVRHFDPDVHPSVLAPLRRTFTGRKVVNTLLGATVGYARLWQDALLRAIGDFSPDLVLVIPLSIVPTSLVGEMRRRSSAKIAGWFQDAVVNFGKHEFLLADYDALFFKDPFIIERLREYGGITNVHYLPESCEPQVHHPLDLTAEDRRTFGCDLMVYGNLYAYRAKLLEGLLDMDLRFYGSHPGRWLDHPLARAWTGREVYHDDKIRAVLAAKIVLNTSHFGEVRSVNARTFEVAGIGGFQVADAPGMAEFFTPGEEIVTFKGPKQLREAVHHYLSRPAERAAIAARGMARAHREHTYERRLDKLLGVVGLGARVDDGGVGVGVSRASA